jgi:hypothetical protein
MITKRGCNGLGTGLRRAKPESDVDLLSRAFIRSDAGVVAGNFPGGTESDFDTGSLMAMHALT